MFNIEYVHQKEGYFTSDDYRRITKAEQIRNASDYDDFYVTSKEEARLQVEDAKYIISKVHQYMKDEQTVRGMNDSVIKAESRK